MIMILWFIVTFAALFRKGGIMRFFSSSFVNSTGVDLRSTTSPHIFMQKNLSYSSTNINSSMNADTKVNSFNATSSSGTSANSAHTVNTANTVNIAVSNASNNTSNSCNKQARYDFYLGTNISFII